VSKQIIRVLSEKLLEKGCLLKRAETNGHNGNGRAGKKATA